MKPNKILCTTVFQNLLFSWKIASVNGHNALGGGNVGTRLPSTYAVTDLHI